MNFANTLRIVSFGFVFLTVQSTVAQTNNSLKPNKSYKTLIVETVYPYSVTAYSPPVAVPSDTQKADDRETPEIAFFKFIASMKTINHSWNNSLWSPQSQVSMRQRELASSQDKGYWERLWRSQTTFKYTLLNRVEYSNYVIIEYEIDAEQKKTRIQVHLKKLETHGF